MFLYRSVAFSDLEAAKCMNFTNFHILCGKLSRMFYIEIQGSYSTLSI